jgi:predicted TIM-barrel fold metal-dependent hydrolase
MWFYHGAMITFTGQGDTVTIPSGIVGRAFDADNHYYEAPDAFIRHIEPAMAKRAMQWADLNGRPRLLVGGQLNRFIPNPLFDPVAKPGSLDEYFRGRNPHQKDMRALFGDLEPIRPEYRSRDARLSVMDAQGLAGTFLFPTLAVGMEESLSHDPPALVAAFRAFNRWLDEDWGFAYQDRIFAAPLITLVDVDAAVAELEWVLDRDARVICLKGGPVRTSTGRTSPGDRGFDPFWARVDEAGVTVGIHSGDAGYNRYLEDWEPQGNFEAFRHTPLRTVLSADRPPYETMAALICQGVFDRFPRVRVASIEAGAEWVPPLAKKLRKAYGQNPGSFASDPLETLRSHIWVAPFYEDDFSVLRGVLGIDQLLFGSDWPHAEGLTEPLSFVNDLRRCEFSDDEIRSVMVDNALPLAVRLP